MKIPLFDIDGTLLAGGNGNLVHRRGFDYAFQTVYGLQDLTIEGMRSDGMIDKQIVFEMVKKAGISEQVALDKLDEAMGAIYDYFVAHQSESVCELALGTRELLSHLQALNIPLGLLTGNLEAVAWSKLRQADIADFFTFGAFGNLALQRVDLVPIASERACQALGTAYSLNQFVIIGDSPLDVQCAKDGGIEVIGVGAANFTSQELLQAGADLAVDSLEEVDKITAFLR